MFELLFRRGSSVGEAAIIVVGRHLWSLLLVSVTEDVPLDSGSTNLTCMHPCIILCSLRDLVYISLLNSNLFLDSLDHGLPLLVSGTTPIFLQVHFGLFSGP